VIDSAASCQNMPYSLGPFPYDVRPANFAFENGPTESGARSTPSVIRMKRVAIFGNAGGGKSTLARELAAITGLPLHVIDKIRFRASLLGRDEWQSILFARILMRRR
jgi:hypothetical protein